jgi:hypothetical protein
LNEVDTEYENSEVERGKLYDVDDDCNEEDDEDEEINGYGADEEYDSEEGKKGSNLMMDSDTPSPCYRNRGSQHRHHRVLKRGRYDRREQELLLTEGETGEEHGNEEHRNHRISNNQISLACSRLSLKSPFGPPSSNNNSNHVDCAPRSSSCLLSVSSFEYIEPSPSIVPLERERSVSTISSVPSMLPSPSLSQHHQSFPFSQPTARQQEQLHFSPLSPSPSLIDLCQFQEKMTMSP